MCQYVCDKISGKILLINQNHFSGFLRFIIFFLKLKGELTRDYENYAHGNSYSYYEPFLLLLSCTSYEPFRVTPSISSG